MSEFTCYFQKFKKDIKSEIHVALTATVTNVYPNGRIDAKPEGLPLLVNMRKLRGSYEVGNEVLIVFLDGGGQHDLSHGIVVGRLG